MFGRVSFAIAFCALLTTAVAAREKSELASQIEAKYLTKTGVDRVRITEAGPVFVLQVGGVMAAPGKQVNMPVNNVDVTASSVTQIGGKKSFMTGLMANQSDNKSLAKGTKVYLIKAEVKNDDLIYWIITADTMDANEHGTTKPTRYKALLNFGSGFDTLSVDEVNKKLAGVIAPEEFLAEQSKAAEAAANAPQSIRPGMTMEQVIAAWGQPKQIVDFGQKKTLIYSTGVKVILVDSKVTDVQ